MFIVQYDTLAGLTEMALTVPPRAVEYPEPRAFKEIVTEDGAIVIQRPLIDARPRKWIWEGYGPTTEPFASQWAALRNLEYRFRLERNLDPIVGIWEDVTGTGGFDRRGSNGERVFTRVKILQVSQEAGGYGRVQLQSVLDFRIADSTYKAF